MPAIPIATSAWAYASTSRARRPASRRGASAGRSGPASTISPSRASIPRARNAAGSWSRTTARSPSRNRDRSKARNWSGWASAATGSTSASGCIGGPKRYEVLAVVAQLLDGLVDVGERGVRAALGEPAGDFRPPALAQLLERAHVEVAIVEVRLERGHEAREEAAVLADRVARHRRGARRHPAGCERQRGRLGGRLVERRCLHLVDESAAPVGGLVPVVHRVEHRIGLVDDPGLALGEDVEVAVGHHDRQLDDAVAL